MKYLVTVERYQTAVVEVELDKYEGDLRRAALDALESLDESLEAAAWDDGWTLVDVEEA